MLRGSEKGEINGEKEVRKVDDRGRQIPLHEYRAIETAVFLFIVLLPEISLT